VLLLLVAASLAVLPVEAADEGFWTSGNAFVRYCSSIDKDSRDSVEMQQKATCASYVMGLDDGAFLRVAGLPDIEPYCYKGGTEGLEQGQIVRILLKYIRNNPEKADQIVPALFLSAMRQAFPPPCSAEK
jgi:hypothetical protein